MARSTPRRRPRDGHVGALEVVCVALVLAAIVGLVIWIVTHAGGGHLLI